MKKNKYLIIAISILILICVLATGCKKGEETVDETDVQTSEYDRLVDNNYTIVRPNEISINCLDKVEKLKAVLDAQSNGNIEIKDDYFTEEGVSLDDTYEILIGQTNRTQSAQAIEKITDYGYVIETVGNKIVINGSNEMMTELALDYLISNEELNSGKWIFDEAVLQGGFGAYILGNATTVDFSVYVPADKQEKYEQITKSITSKAKTMTGVAPAVITNLADCQTKYIVSLGINAEVTEILGKTEPTVCAIFVSNNTIYLSGNTVTAITNAATRFTRILHNCVTADGNIKFYDGYSVRSIASNDIYSVPDYDFGGAASVIENNPGYVASVQNTSAADFDKYIETVKSAGFTVHSESVKKNNKFATLYNESLMIHTYYIAATNSVKIISEPVGYLYQNEASEIEKITDPSVTQLALDYKNKIYGMSYIIQLEDSTFILVDGGMANTENYSSATKMLNKMKELNKRTDGKIIINSWIITHAHADHYQTLQQFAEKYAKEVILGEIIINTPSTHYSTGAVNFDKYNSTGQDIRNLAQKFSKDVKIYTPHTGQDFYIKNIRFEVLYTYEDLYPQPLKEFNDSGIVTRMTIGGNTILWAADSYHTAGNTMESMWDTYLKSDILQLPHHGYDNGGGGTFYKKVSAKVALWSQSLSIIDASWTTYAWLDYAGTKEIIYADPKDVTLVFPYVK